MAQPHPPRPTAWTSAEAYSLLLTLFPYNVHDVHNVHPPYWRGLSLLANTNFDPWQSLRLNMPCCRCFPPTTTEAREIGQTQTQELNDRSKHGGGRTLPLGSNRYLLRFLQVMRMGISPIDMRSS